MIMKLWMAFKSEAEPAWHKRLAVRATVIALYGYNSPPSMEANRQLIQMHLRTREDWHHRLRQFDLRPEDCASVLTRADRHLLLQLIGHPIFAYKANEDYDEDAYFYDNAQDPWKEAVSWNKENAYQFNSGRRYDKADSLIMTEDSASIASSNEY
ncbi:hypothetical protein EVG20_g3330 [Dentipellis fragilis]|uniref:Uncharacterized protein n=1 Tax=Dentipellis fragilis TaxID=205917 RepID=A0A4Y9Z550_9AGAM|nr:hypothetical protein EVG20_g3330 [Dentipellis fragilis]